MKNSKLSISRVVINCAFAILLTFLFQSFTVGAIAMIPTALQIAAPALKGMYSAVNFRLVYMAIQTEVWVADVEENLFFENEFIRLAVDHTSYLEHITVHVPQAGANPSVQINRVDDETAVSRRVDTDLTYNLKNFTTDPILIKDIEQLQISYEKRTSVMGQHIAVLNDAMALQTLYSWAVGGPTAAVVRTTGATDNTYSLPSATATGYRKILTKTDLATAALKMDLQKMPKAGRFIVIPSCMFYGLFTDTELLKIRALLGDDMIKMGVLGEIFSWNIIVRGEVVRYNNLITTNAANALQALPNNSQPVDQPLDCAGAVGFSRYYVSQAMGEVFVYINEKQAKSYGDILSAEVNQGAARLRTDNKGVVCIAQGYSATA